MKVLLVTSRQNAAAGGKRLRQIAVTAITMLASAQNLVGGGSK